MIKILIVDDQSIVREGLTSLLQNQPDIKVIGEAENGKIAVEKSLNLKPDIVLMDIRMPIMDGIAAMDSLAEKAPEIKILVLTTFDDDDYINKAMSRGAKGYLLKDTPSEELAQAIRSIDRGYTQLGPGLFEKAIQFESDKKSSNSNISIPPEFEQLTSREKEVLGLIAIGYSNKEIAEQLYITERTVKNHVNSILRRLQLRDRTQAAIFANTYLK